MQFTVVMSTSNRIYLGWILNVRESLKEGGGMKASSSQLPLYLGSANIYICQYIIKSLNGHYRSISQDTPNCTPNTPLQFGDNSISNECCLCLARSRGLV